MITTEPLDDSDKLRAYRYPLISSLFFGVEQVSVLDCFYEYPELPENLFIFLDNTEKLNFLLAGYFAKAVDSLVSRDCDTILKFIFAKDYQTKMIRNLYNPSIADLAVKVLEAYNSEEDYISERLGMIEELMSNLKSSDFLISINSEYVLEKIISDKSVNLYTALLEFMISDVNLGNLFNNLLADCP